MAAEEATYNFEVFDLTPLADLGDAVEDVASLPPGVRALCDGVARALHETGCLVVRAPGAGEDLNNRFLDLMEAYFGRPDADKMADVRPEFSYQVGATPSGVERPRCLADPDIAARMAALPARHAATPVSGADVKWRFFWRVGPRPADGGGPYAELNAPPVVPAGFDGVWAESMDAWGNAMLNATRLAATAAAVGFGLPPRAISSLMDYGPHLLAPTGSDLIKHGAVGTVLAGYHYDLNLLTIHGRSRFPGLFVWLRDGRRVPVRGVPAGCLLIQAGKQLEWLTAGYVKAGYHEVVVTDATAAAAAAAAAAGRSAWRVSSTTFAHVASARVLAPLGRFAQLPGADADYPPTQAGAQVQAELAAIRLAASSSRNGGGGANGGANGCANGDRAGGAKAVVEQQGGATS